MHGNSGHGHHMGIGIGRSFTIMMHTWESPNSSADIRGASIRMPSNTPSIGFWFGIGGSFSEMVTVVSVISTIRVSVISVAETITVTVSVTVTVMAVVISSGIGVSLGLSGHDGEEGNCKDSLFMNNRAN